MVRLVTQFSPVEGNFVKYYTYNFPAVFMPLLCHYLLFKMASEKIPPFWFQNLDYTITGNTNAKTMANDVKSPPKLELHVTALCP